MKACIISLGAKSSKDVAKECKNYFKKVDHLNLKKIRVHVSSKGLRVFYEDKDLEDYDCVYIRGSHKYSLLKRSITSALMDKVYVPISPSSFTIGNDKFLTMLHLARKKVPIPKTYLAMNAKKAREILKEVNYPIIMKVPSGTQGKGIVFADTEQSAKSVLDLFEVLKQPLIIQEFIDTSATDVRAIVVGDKVVASMKRIAKKGDLRANFHMGGKCRKYEMSYEAQEVAINAAKAVKAEICGVDILEGRKPMVIETNLSPGFQGLNKAIKKNVGEPIAKYLFEKTKEFKESGKKKDVDEIMNGLEKSHEIITNLNIKEGVIKIPRAVASVTKFDSDKEVVIKVEKGKLLIEDYK